MTLHTSSLAPSSVPTVVKDRRLLLRREAPLALDPPLALLDDLVTPIERIFVRSRQTASAPEPDRWECVIDGLVRHPLLISYADLAHQPLSSFFAALIGQMQTGNDTSYGPLANAEWIGAPLSLFLEAAGVKPQAAFAACWSNGPNPIVRYLPLASLWQDGMLAYAINGLPLPVVHGGPVRLVAPGWAGTYWVKWIERITLISAEKAPPEAHRDGRLAVDGRLLNLPAAGLRSGDIYQIRGVAWSAANGVAQVMVSFNGAPWHPADLDLDLGPRAWRRFCYDWPVTSGDHLIRVQITDLTGQTAVRQWAVRVSPDS